MPGRKARKKKSRLNKLLMPALVILLGLVGVFIFRDRLFDSVMEIFLSRTIGTKVSMDKFYLNIALGQLDIEGLKIENPPGFTNETLLDLPKIAVKFDRLALATGRLNISRADIYLKKLLFEKDKRGKMNVDALKIASAPNHQLHVDILNLKIVTVVEKDCRGSKPIVKGHYLNLDKSYRNINGVNDLVLLMIKESLKNSGIEGAKVFGLSALLGGPVAIPFAVVINDIGKGRVQHEVAMGADNLYDISMKVLDDLGEIKKEERRIYQISAQVQGTNVTVGLKPESKNLTTITITAKKFFLAQDEVAGGILYEITEQVKAR